MELTIDQMEEAAFIFEKENGNAGDDYSRKVLAESILIKYNVDHLEKIIVDGLNDNIYINSDLRVSAYWALSKRFNRNLIASFKGWLKSELDEGNGAAIYQILIALDNMGEPVFNVDRKGGSSVYEIDLNVRDTKTYLTSDNL